MQHIYTVSPVPHQPEWPANDNELETRCRDRRIALALLLMSAALVLGAAFYAMGLL